MPRLIDVENSETIEVPDEQVSDLLNTGRFNLPNEIISEGKVQVVDKNGDIVLVDLQDTQEALQSGYRLESSKSFDNRALQEEYGGPGGMAAALATGAAKGLSVGLATPVLEAAGVPVAELEQANPGSFTAGDIGGTVAGLFSPTGWAGAAGKVAGKGVQGAAALSRQAGIGAAKGAAKFLGTKGARSKAAGLATEGVIDGAIYGAGEGIHQAAVSKENADFTGQLSSIAGSAASGAVLGGGLGLLSVPVVAALKKSGGAVGRLAGDQLGLEKGKTFSDTESLFTAIAEEQALKGIGGRKRFRKIWKKQGDAWLGRAKKWFNESTVVVDDAEVPLFAGGDTWEDIVPKIDQKRDELGREIGRFYKTVDATKRSGEGFDFDSVITRLDELEPPKTDTAAFLRLIEGAKNDARKNALIEDLLSLQSLDNTAEGMLRIQFYAKKFPELSAAPTPEAAISLLKRLDAELSGPEIKAFYDEAKDFFGGSLTKGSFDEAWQIRREYSSNAYKNRLSEAAKADTQKKIAAAYTDEIKEGADSLLRKLGDTESFPRFEKINKEYGYASDLGDAVSDRALAQEANNTYSLRDGQLIPLTAAAGAWLGGPVGAVIGTGLGAVGTKYLRERGLSYSVAGARIIADLAKNNSKFTSRIADRAQKIASGKAGSIPIAAPLTAKILSKITITGQTPEGKTKEEIALSLGDQLDQVLMDPETYINQIAEDLQILKNVAPEVAQSIAETKTRMVKFLAEKRPRMSDPYSQLQPNAGGSRYDSKEVDDFAKYLYAASNPAEALFDDMSDGVLSPQTVETINVIYPSLLEKIKVDLAEKLEGEKRILSNTEQAQLSVIFGEPIVRYQTPEFMRRQQMQYKQQAKSNSMAGLKRSSAKVGRMEELMTTGPQAVNLNLKQS